MAGRKQINQAQRDKLDGTQSDVAGWLVFWSIIQKERQVSDLVSSAQTAGLPANVIAKISGRSSKSAWLAATQLGAKGKPSRTFDPDPKGSTARYLTRNLKEESRAMIREVIDSDGEQVASYQVAVLYHLNSQIEFSLDRHQIATNGANDAHLLEQEVRKVIGGMSSDMASMVGQVDDGKIRNILLDWLTDVHRICVRGTGGVYFVPRPRTGPSALIEAEMIALRAWVNSDPVSSTFSIVEVNRGGATTVGDFAKTALEELMGEVKEIHENLDRWGQNGSMNDGSRMFSSQTMVERADQLIEKAGYLADALGEELFVAQRLAEKAKEAAMSMLSSSTAAVDASKAVKVAAKAAKSAPVEASKDKKSGTAASRAAKVVVE